MSYCCRNVYGIVGSRVSVGRGKYFGRERARIRIGQQCTTDSTGWISRRSSGSKHSNFWITHFFQSRRIAITKPSFIIPFQEELASMLLFFGEPVPRTEEPFHPEQLFFNLSSFLTSLQAALQPSESQSQSGKSDSDSTQGLKIVFHTECQEIRYICISNFLLSRHVRKIGSWCWQMPNKLSCFNYKTWVVVFWIF